MSNAIPKTSFYEYDTKEPAQPRGERMSSSRVQNGRVPEERGNQSEQSGETRTESRQTTDRYLRTTRIKNTLRHTSDEIEQNEGMSKASDPTNPGDGEGPTWRPEASLIPHTSAPLAQRVSNPPLASKAPSSLLPTTFNDMTLEEQEIAVIEDMLYVLMGLEGQYIRYAESYKATEEKSRLVGPQFKLVSGLDPSLKDLVAAMLKTATYYVALETFIEVQSKEECGMVNHALCAAMRDFLKDYLILVAQIENQYLTSNDFTLHVMNLHLRSTGRTLSQLYSISSDILRQNSLMEDIDMNDASDDFDNILESLKGDGELISGKKVCKGGAVIKVITEKYGALSGDPTAKEVYGTLLSEASRPYMAMLNEWLHHGNVRDPHQEFLIKEQQSIKREGLEQDYTDEYWEKRYTLRIDSIPPQLDALKDKVLLAGKYLNVVRECGGVDTAQDMDKNVNVPHTFDDLRFLENVHNAYAFANSSLLTLLVTTHSLSARLQSLKHYFFLDRSDFLSYFLELGRLELKKSARAVNVGKLQSLLDIVLRQPGSVTADDPFKEDVKIIMSDIGLTAWLMQVVNVKGLDAEGGSINSHTPAAHHHDKKDKDIVGFEALTFDFVVPFPLSLVVSRVTLTRYQLLFRYLLSLRHLETLLTTSWSEQTKTPIWRHRSSSRAIENWKRRAWTLRCRMLCFVQQLLYFCTSEVIEPNWNSFMTRLESSSLTTSQSTFVKSQSFQKEKGKARTVDELMQDHVDFLATCLKECMLTNSKLLRINSKVMTTCTLFAEYSASFSRNLSAADPDAARVLSSSQEGNIVHDEARLRKLQDNLKSFEDNFGRHLKILLDALNYLAATETVVFLSLCARLSMANEGFGQTLVHDTSI